MGPIPRLITAIVGWAAGKFYRVQRIGRSIPDGPVLVVANHPNSLLDPMVIFRTAGRTTRPLAKAPLFEHPLVGPALRGLGGLPVYRRQDDPTLMQRNEQTFARAIDALLAGDAVQIYPEGRSHSEPRMAPLRTGAARIALGAEAAAGWSLGLRIVPVGLTYARKTLFRGQVAVEVGESFPIAELREAYEADPVETVRRLTAEIAERLEAVTLNLSSLEDHELIEAAERLYVREKSAVRWRERDGLGDRKPRLQAFARGLAWLRAHDPERHRRLARSVARYRRLASMLGAEDGDVPPRYEARGVARFVLRELLVLGIGLPVAVAGILVWYPPYAAPRLALRLVRPEHEVIATYKLTTVMVAAPVTYAAWLTLAWALGGAPVLLLAVPILPLLGLAAHAWSWRGADVLDDARLFFRVLRRPRSRDRLAARRAALVEEFDAIRGLLPPLEPPLPVSTASGQGLTNA